MTAHTKDFGLLERRVGICKSLIVYSKSVTGIEPRPLVRKSVDGDPLDEGYTGFRWHFWIDDLVQSATRVGGEDGIETGTDRPYQGVASQDSQSKPQTHCIFRGVHAELAD